MGIIRFETISIVHDTDDIYTGTLVLQSNYIILYYYHTTIRKLTNMYIHIAFYLYADTYIYIYMSWIICACVHVLVWTHTQVHNNHFKHGREEYFIQTCFPTQRYEALLTPPLPRPQLPKLLKNMWR